MKRQFKTMRLGNVAVLALIAAQGHAQVTSISVGSTVTGILTTTSAGSLRRPGAYAAYYSMQGTAGQKIAISLSATRFDAYLYLIGPNGAVLSENDDDGTSSDSRIPMGTEMLTLPTTGAYTIEATTFSTNSFGPYALRVDGSCVQAPLAVVRFDKLEYVTDPDARGVRLLAGQMSAERLQQIGAGVRNLPQPAFTDQKFCGMIDVATSVSAEVFVPTAAERLGDYSQSGIVLWDPITRRTLVDGTVVMDPFPNSIVPISRLQPGGIFAWRLAKLVNSPPVTAPTVPVIAKVVNAFGASSTISPNTWVVIAGTHLALNERTWRPSDFLTGRMPTTLDGVTVTIGGKSAYLFYISMNQLNVLTPPDLALGPLQVQVMSNGAVSASFVTLSQQYSLSLFTFDGTHVAGTHADGSLLGPISLFPGFSSPAKASETVILYANGFGPTSPPAVSGEVLQSGSLPVLPIVRIGGIPATVQYAGLISPGLYQLNVVIPVSVQDGTNAVTVTYNGLTTQANVDLMVEGVLP